MGGSSRPSRRLSSVSARVAFRSVAVLCFSLVAIAVAACSTVDTGTSVSPPPAASPTAIGSGAASASPTASDGASPSPVAPGDEVQLEVGDSAAVTGTDVTLTLLEASGPAVGCSDCPNHARLRVECPAGPEDLDFTFSGGMDAAAMERARQRSACGLDFYIAQVNEGRATVRVLSPG